MLQHGWWFGQGKSLDLWLFESAANAFSSVEQYVIMIAASIPITLPAFRWVREKLSGYRYVIASWTALDKKTETVECEGIQRSRKNRDPQSDEYILPKYVVRSGKDLIAVTNRDLEWTIHEQEDNNCI